MLRGLGLHGLLLQGSGPYGSGRRVSAAVFRCDPLPDTPTVRLDGPEGRHAATVRRLRVGEAVVLTDGRGRSRTGTVRAVGRDHVDVAAAPAVLVPEPDPRLVVVQALPKGERADLALELLTELGADEIVPWAAERAVVQWTAERRARGLDRWRRTVQEAGKQSRRTRFPLVADLADLAGLVARLAVADAAFVLHEEATRPLVAADLPDTGTVVVVVGPEGGIGTHELAALTAAGAVAVHLGAPVLRTSTAGGAALAVLSARLGRWT